MTNAKDIENYMEMSLKELSEICIDPDILAKIWAIAINIGIQIGRQQNDEYYHKMFGGYNERTISN